MGHWAEILMSCLAVTNPLWDKVTKEGRERKEEGIGGGREEGENK